MLKNISPLISPDLLKALCEMGHGDTIVLADAHFPAYTLGPDVLRADGIPATELLKAILPLIELDTYVDAPVMMMQPVPGDTVDPELLSACENILPVRIASLERFVFYEEAKKAYVIVQTGETRKYGNIILKKGVIAV